MKVQAHTRKQPLSDRRSGPNSSGATSGIPHIPLTTSTIGV